LRRILNSPHFDTSDRNRRFLEYVVEETLAGRHDRIKAYTIATVVFGRDDGFDPTLDPVVRMEARRLRRSLERFYLVEGEVGLVRIELPKGGYVPKFQSPAAGKSVPERSQLRRIPAWANTNPSVLIASFDARPKGLADFCDGLARRIVVGMGRFPELRLFMRLCGRSSYADDASAVDFMLSGDTTIERDALKVTVTLLHSSSGEVLWAQTLVGDAREELPDPRDKIADLIAGEVWARITARDDLGRCSNSGGRPIQLSRVV
jgi:adenylate cyclase